MSINDFEIGDRVEVKQLTFTFKREDTAYFKERHIQQRTIGEGTIVMKYVGIGSNSNSGFLLVCQISDLSDKVAVYVPDELENKHPR